MYLDFFYSRLINQSSFLYSRLVCLGNQTVKEAFVVYSSFLREIYANTHFYLTTYRLKELEKALLNSDFGKFVAAAKFL